MFKIFTRSLLLVCLLFLVSNIVKANDSDVVNCGKPFKIVLLGSSTTFGNGATPIDSSWASKFTNYVKRKNTQTIVYNLGVPGYSTYEVLCPNGFTPPANRPSPAAGYNITEAIRLHPDAIIINLPSNDAYANYTVAEQQANYERALTLANAANIPVWVSTTQPRNNMTTAQVNNLTQMRDWTYLRFGSKAVDFWTTIANSNGSIVTAYDYDGTHLNNLGHDVLYKRILAENILDSLCNRNNGSLVARAGSDTALILPANSLLLNGSASSGANPVTSYLWTKVSGPQSGQIANASAASTTVSNLIEGKYAFELVVRDNFLSVSRDTINVTVSSRILIDFGSTATTIDAGGRYWNNIANTQPGIQLQNAVTTANAATTIGLEVVNRLDGTYDVSGAGVGTGNTAGIVGDYPNSATTDFAFAQPSASNGSWKFSGLNTLKQYTFKFWGTRSVDDDRIIEIRKAGETTWKEYNASNNTSYSNAAIFTVAGQSAIAFDIRVKTGSVFGYINVVDITTTTASTSANLPPVSNAGANTNLSLPSTAATLDGSASTDEDGEISTYQWTKVAGPATYSIAAPANAVTAISNLTEGVYVFELLVTDNNGATAKDSVTITVGSRILLDFGSSLTASPDADGKYWNNVTNAQPGIQLQNALTTTNLATTITLTVVNRIDGTYDEAATGTGGGNSAGDVGDYPNSSTTDFAFAQPSTTTGNWKLTGLDAQKQYTVKFWGTRSVDDDRITQIKMTEESVWQEYNASNNISYNNAASFTFTGKTEQAFDIRTKAGSVFGYINVIDISETIANPVLCTPVTPSVTITANVPAAACAGTSITFTAAITNGGTNPVYQWTKNNVVIDSATSNTYTNNNFANNDIIRCNLTSNADCATTPSALSNQLTLAVKMPTTSVTTISACNSYTWNGINYTVSGTYTKTGLINKAGCDSTATLNLTVKVGTTSTTTVSACKTYTWNGVAYTNSGTYTKTGLVNKAGCDSTAKLILTISKTAIVPGVISGPVNACPYTVSSLNPNGILATYTIAKVAGVSSYVWLAPPNSSIEARPGGLGTANDTIIKVKFNSGFVSGNIAVLAINPCGTSTNRTLAITKTLPSAPGTITGIANPCANIISATPATYKIAKVAGAVDYDWAITGSGATISHPAGEGVNDTIVNVLFTAAFTQGTLSVKSVGNCGTNATAKTFAIAKASPGAPTIKGNVYVCASATVAYTASSLYATSYIWTIPSGAKVVGASNAATITIKFPSFFLVGSISAKAVSPCGTSAAGSLSLSSCLFGSNKSANETFGKDDGNTTANRSSSSVVEENLPATITVYPNPSPGNFTINVTGNNNAKPVSVEVLDNYGRLIYKTTDTHTAIPVNITGKLANGIYFVRCNVDGTILTQKVVISR